MEVKDVKVGMRVVPHKKTAGCSWECWDSIKHSAPEAFRNNGFLYVYSARGNGGFGLWGSMDAPALGSDDFFNASDFEPAQIEAGDTVRVISDEHIGGFDVGTEATVIEFPAFYTANRIARIRSGSCNLDHNINTLDLVRKAKKPADPEKPADTRYRPKNGERVRIINAAGGIGEIGTVEDENKNGVIYVAGVRMDDGDYWAVKECEPAPADRRPTVGDWVEVLRDPRKSHRVGDVGVIVRDDRSPFPYLVCLNGDEVWYAPSEVKLTTPPEQKPRELKPWRALVYKPVVMVKKSDADAAVRRAYCTGYNKGQLSMIQHVTGIEAVPNPSAEEMAKFWEAD